MRHQKSPVFEIRKFGRFLMFGSSLLDMFQGVEKIVFYTLEHTLSTQGAPVGVEMITFYTLEL